MIDMGDCSAALQILHSDAMGQWPSPDMLDSVGRKVVNALASGRPVLFE